MKIALGSVQFGQAYGAFNDAGQVSIAEVEAILDMARSHGITTLDTAQAYGASEEVLGRLEAGKHFTIVTKIPSLAGTSDRAAAIKRCITQSCEALKVQRLDALLFHSANDLLGDSAETCWRTAEQAYLAGRVDRLGVSVYHADDALMIADRFPISLVQLPVSIFDQRALHSGALSELKARGIEVHARSVFLQGFALSELERLPPGLLRFRSELEAFRAFAARHTVSPLVAALGFVLGQRDVDRAVVGVQSTSELSQIIHASRVKFGLAGSEWVASSKIELLNPGLWPKNGDRHA